MKAMVLAAGLGTRLRPLTNDRPKALVEVAGRTMLEITLARLREFGIREVIINAHHFAEMIADYLQANRNFGMQIEISREDVLLDTGGGLKKAAHFFLRDGSDRSVRPTQSHNGIEWATTYGAAEPFFLHNVDVVSTIDLRRMVDFHIRNQALATLAVQERESSRYLLFDEDSLLCGRKKKNGATEGTRSALQVRAFAFCGIHVISPRLFGMMQEDGAFSIIDTYLRLAAGGERISGFRADEYYWRDLGKPENVAQAGEDLRRGVVAV